MTCRIHLTTSLLSMLALTATAQRPDSVTGELQQTFREVTAVREMADGRALVLDSHERFVYLADFRAGTVRRLGEQGWGDRQYLWPSRLLTIPGDTILVWDAIEGRMHVLTADGASVEVRKSIPQSAVGTRGGAAFVAVMSDSLGRLYRQEQHSRRLIVTRLNETRTAVDTVINVLATRDVSSQLFPSYSRWTVDATGRVAHVLVKPYRVDLYAPNGTATTGSDIPFVPTEVTPAVQKAWLEVLHRPRIIWASQAGGPPGFIESQESQVVYGSWPLVMPPVVGHSFLGFAGDGSLLIERLALPGMPSEYDVVGQRGELVDRFQLAANAQVVATGNRAVYVTVRGPDNRLKLQRFSIRTRR